MENEPQKTKFKWDADGYARHSSVQQEWARELIRGLNLRGDESLLDIGCGDGKVTAEIANHLKAGSVVGVDNSEAMIELAKRNFPIHKYPNLKFQMQDARELSFIREFNVVFSNAALHWVIDHRSVLQGIYRALKPNGRVVAQMGGRGNAALVIGVVNEIITRKEWQKFFINFTFPYGFYSPEEYAPWLQAAGFKVDRLELKPKDMVHENIEKFKGWVRTTWLPYLQRIPQDLQELFICKLTEKYLQANPPDQNGKIHTVMQRLEYEAIK